MLLFSFLMWLLEDWILYMWLVLYFCLCVQNIWINIFFKTNKTSLAPSCILGRAGMQRVGVKCPGLGSQGLWFSVPACLVTAAFMSLARPCSLLKAPVLEQMTCQPSKPF